MDFEEAIGEDYVSEHGRYGKRAGAGNLRRRTDHERVLEVFTKLERANTPPRSCISAARGTRMPLICGLSVATLLIVVAPVGRYRAACRGGGGVVTRAHGNSRGQT